ncbi:MAG: hypothetical protein R3313_01650 [Candidatus Saccharimonadales bacterium]|nr:hypothetical protein [Candidatus Saccharimonadales bacterium]
MAEVDKKPQLSGLKMPVFKVGQSGMYVLEHFLMLVHVVAALVLINSMFNHLVDYRTEQSADGFLRVDGYQTIVGLLAGTVVVLPLLLFFFLRVKAAEKSDSRMLKKSWRSIWLNTFLAGLFLWFLGALISLVQVLVDGLLSVGLEEGDEELWARAVRPLFALVLISYVGSFFYNSSKAKKDTESRRFMLLVAGVATLLLIMTAVWPLAEQRNSRVDDLIEKDLTSIKTSIDEYVVDENELPAELSDLSLNEEVESRIDKHKYEYSRTSASSFSAEYELCAVFKNDTTNEKVPAPDTFSLLDIADSSAISRLQQDETFSSHSEGRECFDLQSSIYNPFFSEPSQSVDDFDLNSLFEAVQ